MVRSMSRRSRLGRNSSRAFRDGPIYIRRWKARRRAEQLVVRVGRRTLGLAGALVLALPAAVVLIWINWPALSKCALIVDVLRCVGKMVAFLIPCVATLTPVRFLTQIPSFIFRKLMHIVAFSAVAITILMTRSWQAAALTFALAALAAFLLLSFLEGEEW